MRAITGAAGDADAAAEMARKLNNPLANIKTVMTDNRNASSNERWNIPVGGGAGRLFQVGKLPIRTQVQAFYNVDNPSGGADWSLMWTLQFVFPKK